MAIYQDALLKLRSPDMEALVKPYTETIVYRTYEGGNSRDVRRATIPYEKSILESLLFSALCALRFDDAAPFSVINALEFAVNQLLPGVNGYMSFYIPINNILRSLKGDEEIENEIEVPLF